MRTLKSIITLRSTNALPATLLISPRDCAHLSEGLTLEPLLRLVELAMDVCALRARAAKGKSVGPQWRLSIESPCSAAKLESGHSSWKVQQLLPCLKGGSHGPARPPAEAGLDGPVCMGAPSSNGPEPAASLESGHSNLHLLQTFDF